ncbi:1-hydroxycarotenoid 3,4-desaturase [Acidiphilium sp. MT5]
MRVRRARPDQESAADGQGAASRGSSLPIVVIGAGMGGLVAALELAVAGRDVILCEKAAQPGGKLRQVRLGDAMIDAGPTVLTMRPVFEQIFAHAGADLSALLPLRPLEILARHVWSGSQAFDLNANPEISTTAIEAYFGAASAAGYRRFCGLSARIYDALDASFMRMPVPSLPALIARTGISGLAALRSVSPFASLWTALGKNFRDPRLRQLFARYATYSGASPFLAPATLMLIAHVEQSGVWRIEGGLTRLATALADLATAHGAQLRYDSAVEEILIDHGRVDGVRLRGGATIRTDRVIANVELGALAAGQFGAAVQTAVAPAARGAKRSLSAVTWQVVARTRGFALSHHNVFFSADYPAEFAQIARGALPDDPTIYLCAQDRQGSATGDEMSGVERMLVLINAPALGDTAPLSELALEGCWRRVIERLDRAGLTLEVEHRGRTDPTGFAASFPGAGGALYGRSLDGWRDPFARPPARTALPGLYLAGGSAHPGPGLPMAALSGRFAASAVLDDAP